MRPPSRDSRDRLLLFTALKSLGKIIDLPSRINIRKALTKQPVVGFTWPISGWALFLYIYNNIGPTLGKGKEWYARKKSVAAAGRKEWRTFPN